MLRTSTRWRYEHVVALVAALLPTYLIRFTVFGVPATFLEAAIIALFVYGLLQPTIWKRWQINLRTLPQPVALLVGLFIVASAISVFISPHLSTSLGIFKGWIVVPILFGWIVYASRPKNVPIARYQLPIISSLIFSGLIVALLGISQIGQFDRIRSVYDVPNSLALFLAPLIVLSSWLGLFVSKRYIKIANCQLPVTSYYLLSSLIMFIALLATKSAGGIIAVLVAVTIGLVVGYKLQSPNSKLPAIVIVTVLFLVSLPILLDKALYLLQPSSSAAVRLQLWSISWELITDHPLLGIGLGTFEPAYQAKLHERFAEYEQAGNELQITNYKLLIPISEFLFRDPHNWILSFWLNTGLLGLLSFTSFHGWIIKNVYKLQIANYKAQATALALLALLLFGLADTIFWKNDLAVLHLTLVALMLLTVKASSEA